MSRATCTVHWRDNNGKRAETKYTPGPEDNWVGSVAVGLNIAAALAAVSDAVIERVEFRTFIDLDTGIAAPPTSDVKRAAVFFYRNGDNVSSLRLPSPTLLLVETSGPYAGVRITPASVALSSLLAQVAGMVAGAFDPVGRPYGPTFVVGGITQL